MICDTQHITHDQVIGNRWNAGRALRPKGFFEANKVKVFAVLSHYLKCCSLGFTHTLII